MTKRISPPTRCSTCKRRTSISGCRPLDLYCSGGGRVPFLSGDTVELIGYDEFVPNLLKVGDRGSLYLSDGNTAYVTFHHVPEYGTLRLELPVSRMPATFVRVIS